MTDEIKVEFISKSGTDFYFRTMSAGRRDTWRLAYFLHLREFAEAAIWQQTVADHIDFGIRAEPGWNPAREMLVPFIPEAQLAGLMAAAIEFSQKPEDDFWTVDVAAGFITIHKLRNKP